MARNKKAVPDDAVFADAPLGGASGAPAAFDPPLVEASPILPSAIRQEDEDAEPVPVRKFKVIGGGPIMIGSCRTKLPAGKVIDSRGYDIDLIRSQGIELQQIEG
jgi:hypothetical protein